MELVLFFGGALLSWGVSHWYYRKANKEVPDWARPLIDRFPIKPPTIEELVDLYHEAVMDGAIVPHPSGFVKCPECGASANKFESWEHYAPRLDSLFHGYKCSACNQELTSSED